MECIGWTPMKVLVIIMKSWVHANFYRRRLGCHPIELRIYRQSLVKTIYGTSFLSSSCLSNSEIKHYLTHVKSPESSIGSISAWYRGGPGFVSQQGQIYSLKKSIYPKMVLLSNFIFRENKINFILFNI